MGAIKGHGFDDGQKGNALGLGQADAGGREGQSRPQPPSDHSGNHCPSGCGQSDCGGSGQVRYLSLCSGIEAASVAWEPLGWEPVAFSEIEPFPAAVLKHRWPEVPNLGDMTKHEQWNIPSGSVDLLVGGTPCQSFSVAGLRRGLHDPRGGLMLTFLKIAQRIRPRWIVWENVPGVLSSNGGRDFGSLLGGLEELGYGWAYRVLDAQWFGVAQRRRRVFVVGCLGDGAAAAKVLFESESVRRDSAPSREKGKGVAADAQDGFGVSLPEREVVGCLSDGAHMGGGLNGQDAYTGRIMAVGAIPIHDQATRNAGKRGDKQDGKGNGLGIGKPGDPAPTLTKGDKHAVFSTKLHNTKSNQAGKFYEDYSPSLQGSSPAPAVLYENHPNDSRVTGPHEVAPSCVSRFVEEMSPTLRKDMGDNQVAVAMRESGQGYWMEDTKSGTLRAEGENRPSRPSNVVAEPMAVDVYNQKIDGDKAARLTKACGGTNTSGAKVMAVDTYNQAVQDQAIPIRSDKSDVCHVGGVIDQRQRMAVRRLTPKECERLQGFGDDHTLIPWRGKPADQCPDGPRYKALGNSMAVPCMAWIGKRISKVIAESTT